MDSVFRALWLATQTRESIGYSPLSIYLDFAHEFSLISQKKGTQRFCAGYPLVCYILKQLFTSESVKSGRYPLLYIHLRFCERLLISLTLSTCQPNAPDKRMEHRPMSCCAMFYEAINYFFILIQHRSTLLNLACWARLVIRLNNSLCCWNMLIDFSSTCICSSLLHLPAKQI